MRVNIISFQCYGIIKAKNFFSFANDRYRNEKISARIKRERFVIRFDDIAY